MPGDEIRQTLRVPGEERATYRSVLANREFAAILVSQGLSIVGDQVSRIAIAFLVFRETGSAFAASATFAVAYLTYVGGGPMLSALSDRYPRVTLLVISDLGRAAIVMVLAFTHLHVWALFVLLAMLAAFAPAFDSSRSATLPDLLPGEAYARGSALLNLVAQASAVAGFVAGGVLVAGTSIRSALLLDAATFLVSAGGIFGLVSSRPAERTSTETSLIRETIEGVKIVLDNPQLKRLLGFALLGAAAVAAPESLAIPVAAGLGGGSVAAGILTASIPAGFIVASFAVLRLRSERRAALLPGLTLLSLVPLLATPFVHNVPGVVLLWSISGLGSSLQLVASAAYMAATPAHARARAYGLAGTSLMASQGLAQLAGGAVASLGSRADGPGWGVAVLSLLILALTPLVSRSGR